MAYDNYGVLRVTASGGVCRATIDHPPINLLDRALMIDLDRLSREVEEDPAIRVLVVDSANPDFFIAHADVEMLLALPREALPEPATELGFFHAMVDRFRTMPKVTVAVIEGIARGGGCEFAQSLDIRIAARGRAVFGQPEILVGLLPGGSGTQRLPRLVGRGRAMEIVLTGADLDADTADRWGLVNRALAPDEVGPFVAALAERIGSLPAVAIAEAKASLLAAEADPVPGLLQEWQHFTRCLADPESATRMQAFLDAGGQTREVEQEPVGLAPGRWG